MVSGFSFHKSNTSCRLFTARELILYFFYRKWLAIIAPTGINVIGNIGDLHFGKCWMALHGSCIPHAIHSNGIVKTIAHDTGKLISMNGEVVGLCQRWNGFPQSTTVFHVARCTLAIVQAFPLIGWWGARSNYEYQHHNHNRSNGYESPFHFSCFSFRRKSMCFMSRSTSVGTVPS